MKSPFFALFCRFPRVIFGVKAEDIINGGGIFQVFRSDFEANELLYESVFQTYFGFFCMRSKQCKWLNMCILNTLSAFKRSRSEDERTGARAGL